jgi:GTP pyrophosphokinase
MTKPTVEDLARPFETDRERYVDFAKRLHRLIVDLLDRASLDAIQVDFRVKTIESFREKILRKGYQDPMTQTTDLIGLRIVAYYLEDVEQIGQLISKEFHVHSEYSVKKAAELDTDQFGYRSDHYIISLATPRNQLAEWVGYTSLKAEIQVRTALQHAWASVDHKLNYKKIDDAPKELRRRLVRLSALFELADEEFSSIKAHRSELLANRSHDVERGDFSAILNDISFTAYVKNIQSNLFQVSRPHMNQITDGFGKSDVRIALGLLHSLGIRTIDDLNRVIGDDWKKVNKEIDALDRRWTLANGIHITTTHYAIALLVALRAGQKYWSSAEPVEGKGPQGWQAVKDAAQELGYS